MPTPRLLVLLTLTATLAVLSGCGGSSSTSAEQTSSEPAGAERIPLAVGLRPRGAPGRELELSRVTIPPGVALPVHHHAGTQVAYVEQGSLSFRVVEGSVKVMSSPPGERPKVARRVSAGESTTIERGEWIVEQPEVIHQGANETEEPIELLLSTLFERGADAAIPVE